MCAQSLQLWLTLQSYGLYSPPGSSIHGILQARTLEWVATPSARASSWPRGWTCISCISFTGRQALYQLSQQLPTPVFLSGESHGQRSQKGSMGPPRGPWGTQIFSQTSFWVFLWGCFWMSLACKSVVSPALQVGSLPLSHQGKPESLLYVESIYWVMTF